MLCTVCSDCQRTDDHEATPRHRLNELLHHFAIHRKRYSKTKHNVSIKNVNEENRTACTSSVNLKILRCSLNEGEKLNIHMQIWNKNKEHRVVVNEITRLDGFVDIINSVNFDNVLLLEPNQSYDFDVTNSSRLQQGSYRCAFHFRLTIDHFTKDFSSFREIAISVLDQNEPHNQTSEDEQESPFKGEKWKVEKTTPLERDAKKKMFKGNAEKYNIPQYLRVVFRRGDAVEKALTGHMNRNDYRSYEEFKNGLRDGVNSNNYKSYFQTMLWWNEYEANEMMEKYNMSDVELTIDRRTNLVRLKVPGLAEKRPSVLKGDLIFLKVKNSPLAYTGAIKTVEENEVLIERLSYAFIKILEQNNSKRFSVRFTFRRLPYIVQHQAIVNMNADADNVNKVLFPVENNCEKWTNGEMEMEMETEESLTFSNSNIKENPMQCQAVFSVLKGTSLPAPYIIFGPPGTGKTVTMVEAILQIRKRFRKSHILVCTPSNAAADEVTKRILCYLPDNEKNTSSILRVYADSREHENIDNNIKRVTKTTTEVFSNSKLIEAGIVITTLINSARLKDFHQLKFTHIFIDEAGQAMETEAIIPITGLLNFKKSDEQPTGLLVLVGDPQQLGPVCSSHRVCTRGLGKSLLERLMNSSPYENNSNNNNGFNSKFITKLVWNFRSHAEILKISNELFYEGELHAKYNSTDEVSNAILKDAEGKSTRHPLVFHAIVSPEEVEGASPSYFNLGEINVIMEYLRQLLALKQVEPNEIGIITPYARQVFKLRQKLRQKQWSSIEVGTTEVFQGREKKVILVSCVRSQVRFLESDKRFKLGFVKEKKRFNVLMTRAESKMIIVGNPTTLAMDPHWEKVILTAKEKGSYLGCNVQLRDEAWVQDTLPKFERIEKENDNIREP